MQFRPNGDIEARVEDRRDVLRRKRIGDDERESADMRRRVPAACEAPAFCVCARTVDHSLQQGDILFCRSFSGPTSASEATPAASPDTPSTGVPPSST